MDERSHTNRLRTGSGLGAELTAEFTGRWRGDQLEQAPHETLVASEEDLALRRSSDGRVHPDFTPAAGEFTLKGELGSGGSGIVYEAEQRSLKRDVAVKVLRDAHADGWDLLIEGRIAGGIEHPNIVPVHMLALDEAGRPLLVMKRLQGTTWDELMTNAEHPLWRELVHNGDDRMLVHLEILVDVCHAVAAAHRKGVLHLDIKPSNVFVSGPGETYLTDWGCATSLMEASLAGSSRGTIVGTPYFMAPEMVLPDGELDERSDVYMLGAVLFKLVTGDYRNAGSDTTEVIRGLILRRPLRIPPDCPAELARIVERAAAWDKTERHPSVVDFREEVRDYIHHQASYTLVERGVKLLAAAAAPVVHTRRKDLSRKLIEIQAVLEAALAAWSGNTRAAELLEVVRQRRERSGARQARWRRPATADLGRVAGSPP